MIRRRGDQVQPGPEGYRHHVWPRRKLVPEEPRIDLALRRAPGEMQHARVEDGHLIVFWQAHRLSHPHRQNRGAQPMFQWLTHRQVSCQRRFSPANRHECDAVAIFAGASATASHPSGATATGSVPSSSHRMSAQLSRPR